MSRDDNLTVRDDKLPAGDESVCQAHQHDFQMMIGMSSQIRLHSSHRLQLGRIKADTANLRLLDIADDVHLAAGGIDQRYILRRASRHDSDFKVGSLSVPQGAVGSVSAIEQVVAAPTNQGVVASTTVSSLAAQRERIQSWAAQGVSGVAIFAALQREQGWSGSYSAVRRILADIRSSEPPETSCRLDFSPGDQTFQLQIALPQQQTTTG